MFPTIWGRLTRLTRLTRLNNPTRLIRLTRLTRLFEIALNCLFIAGDVMLPEVASGLASTPRSTNSLFNDCVRES